MSGEQRAQGLYPTPHHDLNTVLHELVSNVQSILGDNLIGAYLQGSFAVGDFDLHSDVDWIIVVERELSESAVHALNTMHDRIYNLNSRWAKHLEGSYFPKDELRHGSTRTSNLWYLDNGSRSLIQSDHCNTLVVRSVVREQGIVMAGPDPQTLLDPVSPDALRREIYTTMTWWGQVILDDPEEWNNRFYQAYIVLNYCRMLHDLYRGSPGSKLWGAEWGIHHLDPTWRGLIERSWYRRVNPANSNKLPADPDDYEATLDFLRYVLEYSRELMASQGELTL